MVRSRDFGIRFSSTVLGRAWTMFGSREISKPENYLKTAQSPSRPLVGSRDDAWNIGNGRRHRLILVFIPCHIEPDMRFALTRSGALRQPSSWGIQDIHCPGFSITCHIRSSCSISASWLSSIVCAGVLVICLVVELVFRHALSLTSSLYLVEVETLPSE